MAKRAVSVADARIRLSKDRVLRAAIDLADEGGIESLSMRKLAEDLGVEAMSIYHYVANKDELLNGITDLVVGEFELTGAGPDWRADVRRAAISAHDVLKRHPWACNLIMSGGGAGLARLQWMESLLKRLREAGLSPNLTHHAYHALDSHIIGSTLWQAGYSTMKLRADSATTFLKSLPKNEFRHLLEHAEQHFTKPKKNDVTEFEFGLELILDGLEQIRSGKEVATGRVG